MDNIIMKILIMILYLIMAFFSEALIIAFSGFNIFGGALGTYQSITLIIFMIIGLALLYLLIENDKKRVPKLLIGSILLMVVLIVIANFI